MREMRKGNSSRGIFGSRRVTMRTSLLAAFILVSFSLCAAIIAFNYRENVQFSYVILSKSLDFTAKSFERRVESILNPMKELAAEIPELLGDEASERFDPALRQKISRVFEFNSQILSAYLGFSDGEFVQLYSVPAGQTLSWGDVTTPPGARFALRRISGDANTERSEEWSFYNKSNDLILSTALGKRKYDPRLRPWYLSAKGQEAIKISRPYAFATIGGIGVTVSNEFRTRGAGVFGVDVTLTQLSHALTGVNLSDKGTAFIVDGDGQVVASTHFSRTHQSSKDHVSRLQKVSESRDIIGRDLFKRAANEGHITSKSGPLRLRDSRTDIIEFSSLGESYVGQISPLSTPLGGQTFLAIAEQKSVVLAGADRLIIDNLIVSVVLMFSGVIIMVYLSGKLARPVLALADDAEKLTHLDLNLSDSANSGVAELHQLANGMNSLKNTIQGIQLFIPSAVVEGLVCGDDELQVLGGSTREVTLMFTDAVGFTNLAELMPPQDLMRKLSAYFECLAKPIRLGGGTIDKFIGDSVMAAWNSVEEDPLHAEHACRAALECKLANEKLNELWRSYEWPEMHTRFGLHVGEVVVGNIGSADRMDHTTIGANVNTASRLEGLNKSYGTEILVSETVRDRAGDNFLFRPVDMVKPKGNSIPIKIYELVGERDGETEIVASETDKRRCADWEEVYDLYVTRDWGTAELKIGAFLEKYPEDSIGLIFLDRIQRFVKAPPGDDWDGAEGFTTK